MPTDRPLMIFARLERSAEVSAVLSDWPAGQRLAPSAR
jgi:hypothetical protein